MSLEVWKPIAGYEQFYMVSNLGRVKRLVGYRARKERVLKPGTQSGFMGVALCANGTPRTISVSRLVLMAFVGPGDGLEACHNNHDIRDNKLSNLHWGTRLQNEQEKTEAGRRPECSVLRRLSDADIKKAWGLYKTGLTQTQVARSLGKPIDTIHLLLRGKTWRKKSLSYGHIPA